MRLITILGFAALLAGSCQNGSSDKNGSGSSVYNGPADAERIAAFDSSKLTTIEWIDQSRDFGKIEEGQKLQLRFRFKNTGDKPLVIARVQPSCGCTVSEPPKEPIAPGQEGAIEAVFDSQGKAGINNKEMVVYANTKPSAEHPLKFQVEVTAKN